MRERDPRVLCPAIRGAAVAALLTLTSCATMTTGPSETLNVASEPPGANASLTCSDGIVRTGVTPMTVTIPRRSANCVVEVSKDGFVTNAVKLDDGINRAYWYNFVTTPLVPVGVIGWTGFFYTDADAQSRMLGSAALLTVAAAWTIDHHNGAYRAHEPHDVRVVLQRSAAATSSE